MRFTVGHNFPDNTPGEYSEIVDAPSVAEARQSAARTLYDIYTPYYEAEVFAAVTKWLATDADTLTVEFGGFIFYIEPCDHD